jgi:hypothetical protein
MFDSYTQLFFFSLTHIFLPPFTYCLPVLSNFTTISLGFSCTFSLF